MYNKGLFRKGMALLLTVLLALSLFPVLVFASPQEELTITIDHSNPYHYEGNFGVWVTITDESGQPVPNLPISFKVFEQAGGSVLYNTRTDATGKVVLGFTARAGYSMGVEVVFKGNETYAAKTITEPLFTVVSDSPEPIDCHWDLVDYTVNEQGKISSYTLGLFDSNGVLIEDSFILSNGSTSYDFQVTNGLHTFTVEDYSYLKQTYHTTL